VIERRYLIFSGFILIVAKPTLTDSEKVSNPGKLLQLFCITNKFVIVDLIYFKHIESADLVKNKGKPESAADPRQHQVSASTGENPQDIDSVTTQAHRLSEPYACHKTPTNLRARRRSYVSIYKYDHQPTAHDCRRDQRLF